ncbi:hypothetical protein [Serratia ficaria]|uniref:hypothetical protein n=1 Tax=Serratia ficaria TaxID=61651 RepID=UPI0021BD324C|nr:hypothetical protein [Serratia ficaria]
MIGLHEIRFGAFSCYVVADSREAAEMNIEGIVEAVKSGQPCEAVDGVLVGTGVAELGGVFQ